MPLTGVVSDSVRVVTVATDVGATRSLDRAGVPPQPAASAANASTRDLHCPAAKRATSALVMAPWVTLAHASAARSSAG